MAEFLRPEAKAALVRWREVMIAVAVAGVGLWWSLRSFGALQIVGWAMVVAGVGLAVVGLRRMRFAQGGGGPGVVQIRERRVGYFGPVSGGVVDMGDLVRLELDGRGDPVLWRLIGGPEVVEIPVNAEGADALFDLFANLPGMRVQRMLDLLAAPPGGVTVVWAEDTGDLVGLPGR